MATADSGKLLLIEEWAVRMKEKSWEGSSKGGGDGKRRRKAYLEKKVDHNSCRCCGKIGH
jgi:hypothetical protein